MSPGFQVAVGLSSRLHKVGRIDGNLTAHVRLLTSEAVRNAK